MSTEPVLNQSFDDTIIIDGLPKVDPAKQEKLVGFVKKKFEAYKPLDAELPLDPEGNSLGFIFMRLESPEQAKAAIAQMHGKPMDRVHTFVVDHFAAPDSSAAIPDSYVPLNEEQIDAKPLPYMQDYLLDPAGREQILLRFQDNRQVDQTHICYADPHDENFIVQAYAAQPNNISTPYTDSQASFSPKGTFLYTFHPLGLKIWGGVNYNLCSRVNHPNVSEVSFSPCERYIVTMSEQPAPSVLCDVAVWALATPQAPIVRYNTIVRNQPWPFFKWSADGRYFARVANKKEDVTDPKTKQVTIKLTPMGIVVYDMEKRDNISPKPIPAPNLIQFEFSPTSSHLAFFTLGKELFPSRIVIYDVHNKKELRANPSFGVESCHLVWHQSGEYLLTQVDRRVDKVKVNSILSIYFVNKKNIPVIEHSLSKPFSSGKSIPVHYPIHRVQCSPTQPMILTTTFKHAEKRPEAEFSLWTFSETGITQTWHLSIPFPSHVNSANLDQIQKAFETAWSPVGDIFYFCVFSKIDANVTVLDCSRANHVQMVASDLQLSHANSISWDYSGRYFALASLRAFPNKSLHQKNKNNHDDENENLLSRLQFYTFQGQMLYETKLPQLFSFSWRPQPILALTKVEQDQVRANLRQDFWNKFSTFDDNNDKNRNSTVMQRRNALKAEWKELRARLLHSYQETKDDRKSCYDGICSDEENEDDFEVVEFSKTERVISTKPAPTA